MPSSYTTRNRLEQQAPGENNNTWGDRLNDNVIEMVDEALDAVEALTVSGSVTLTDNEAATDQARKRVLDMTGTGGTVTIPNVEKCYLVRNATSGTVTFTTGSGTTAVVVAGATKWIFCAGGNVVRQASGPDFGTMAVAGGNAAFAGTLSCTGNATLGDGTGDTQTLNGDVVQSGDGNSTYTSSGATAVHQVSFTSATYTGQGLRVEANRAAGAGTYFLAAMYSNVAGGQDAEFIVYDNGRVFSDFGTSMSSPADYADMMEWADGNPKKEDRVGYSVVYAEPRSKLIRKATKNDDPRTIIGIVSGNPTVTGGAAWNHWSSKYLSDDFNRPIYEKYGRGKNRGQRRKLNPKYDPETPYTPRENRPEWDAVGLVGQVPMRKGCPAHPDWVCVGDVSANVEIWHVR